MGKINSLILIAIVLLCPLATTQEAISTIESRGYVNQWLVCGPFSSDVDGGIIEAIREGRPTLGTKDFMTPLGGMGRIQPQHRLEIKHDGKKAIWQKARSEDGTLDLSPFFPTEPEGVAFAAFYTESKNNQSIYLELESTLGARIFLNGFVIRDFPTAPIELGGRENLLINLRTGMNLIILELPGVSIPALAETMNTSISHVASITLGNRLSLPRKTGFEFNLRIHPVKEMEGIAYVPFLQSLGSFSGQDTHIKQNMVLMLHNPQDTMSSSIKVTARAKGDSQDTIVASPPIPPGETTRIHLPMSTNNRPAGSPQQVSIQLETSGSTTQFMTIFNVEVPSKSGHVYVLTQTGKTPYLNQSDHTQEQIRAIKQQLNIQHNRPEYGFLMGGFNTWYPAWLQMAPDWDTLINLTARGKIAPLTGYTTPDERVVGGELLIRNLLYGHHAQTALLKHWNPVQLSWDSPGFAPQLPQILSRSGVIGLIHNSSYPGLDGLYSQIAPNGSTLLHRKKNPGPQLNSIRDLHGGTDRQRRESLAMRLNSDIYVDVAPESTPSPFWFADPEPLSTTHPQIHIGGGGGEAYFQTLVSDLKWINEKLPATSQHLNTNKPGELLIHPEFKLALSDIEHKLLSAEKWGTLATTQNAPYPTEALDYSWRQLLYHSHPDRISQPQSIETYIDTLTNLRKASIQAIDAGNKAKDSIAKQTNTYANAPVSNNPDASALIVYNSLNWTRTEPVYANITLQNGQGLTLLDESGNKIPFYADRRLIRNRKLAQVRLHFLAKDIPSLGYKTYYIIPTGLLSELEEKTKETKIENEFTSISFKNGHLDNILDIESGEKVNMAPWNEFIAYHPGSDSTVPDPNLADRISSSLNSPATVKIVTSDLFQRAVVSQDFLSGTLTQEYTLYYNLDQLFLSTNFEGKNPDDILAIRFQDMLNEKSFALGERFGIAFQGNNTVSPMPPKEEFANDINQNTVPSFRFITTNQGHQIYTDPVNIPLDPAFIIHGKEPGHVVLANKLVKKLASFGLSAQIQAAEPVTLSSLWTDRTPYSNPNTPFENNQTLRILIGNTNQNESTKNLLKQISPSIKTEIQQATKQAVPYFFQDNSLIEGQTVPTLILSGPTVSLTQDAVQHFLVMLQENTVPPGILSQPKTPPNNVTVMHHGSALIGQSGSELIYLLQKTAPNSDFNQALHFDYAIVPHRANPSTEMSARTAFAYNTPLETRQTDLHLGPLPSTHSFMSTNSESFILTTLKPAMDTFQQLTQNANQPTGQWTARGYNPSSRYQEIALKFSTSIRRGNTATMLEKPKEPLDSSQNSIHFTAEPWGIHTLRIHPSLKPKSRKGSQSDNSVNTTSYASYWEHKTGAAQSDAFKIHLNLKGNLMQYDEPKYLTISNPDPQEPLSGTVTLLASSGWHVSPSHMDYTLPPSGYKTYPLNVIPTTSSNKRGGILAQTLVQDRTVQAVLTMDKNPLTLKVTQNRDEIRVHISNTGGLPTAVTIEVAASPEYWAELNPDYTTEIHPHQRKVQIPAYGQSQVIFRFTGMPPISPVGIKASGNGYTTYETLRLNDL